jgi:hypothetical protein
MSTLELGRKLPALVFLLLVTALSALAQTEGDLTAKQRLFPEVGAGLRAIRRGAGGKLYILESPSPGLIVYDGGKPVLQIGAGLASSANTKARPASIVFGEDCAVDSSGRIYLADRGGNAVLLFSAEGNLLRRIPVSAPVGVVALPQGEVAVATLGESHLILVYDANGRLVREFGDPEDLTSRSDLNRFLNIGLLDSDSLAHVYYAFEYFPEPTVRQYDRFGYAGQVIEYTSLEAFPEAQAVRKEIERQEKRGGTPTFKRVLTALGVDPDTGEVWIALRHFLLHFDKDGNRRATYGLYTPRGARLEAHEILVEKDRLLIGNDPLGIYEFAKPETPKFSTTQDIR